MIIATIGHHDYVLADMKDAEVLPGILDRAKPVNDFYEGDYTGSYLVETEDRATISIRIKATKIKSEEEHQRIQAAKSAKAEKAAKAAGAVAKTEMAEA